MGLRVMSFKGERSDFFERACKDRKLIVGKSLSFSDVKFFKTSDFIECLPTITHC